MLNAKKAIFDEKKQIQDITESSARLYTQSEAVTISQVLSDTGRGGNRTRADIYRSYSAMLYEPIIYQALNLHITNALGGHETTGDVIFIEPKADATDAEIKMIQEINDDIGELLNHVIYPLALNAVAFGDSYARLGVENRRGVTHIFVDSEYMTPLVLPFEKTGKTIGYQVSINGETTILNATQLARFKMPRMGFVPQQLMQQKYEFHNILEDDFSKHNALPSDVGGSFLEGAERPFQLLQTALNGLNATRIRDAVRSFILTANVANMTDKQRQNFLGNLSQTLTDKKSQLRKAIENGQFLAEDFYHLIPVWQDKQLLSIDNQSFKSDGSDSGFRLDDVMFHAKQLAGILGLDLSLLGFSDQLSGGLGDGGFFRISAQSGQRARLIRKGADYFIHHVIDVHCFYKYGGIFDKRPYTINYIGATSALERENQEVRERKISAAGALIQNLISLKDMGAGKDLTAVAHFLTDQCGLDYDDAMIYAKFTQEQEPNNENDFGMEDE